MSTDFIVVLIKQLFASLILPRLREKFGENIPGDIFGDVSAALFELLSGSPITQVSKGMVLAMVDNVIREYGGHQ